MRTNKQLLRRLHYILLFIVTMLWFSLAVPVVQAELYFSEIYASPGKGESEWYELYNDSESDLDISHYQLAKAGAKIKLKPLAKNLPMPLIISAQSYLVLEPEIVLPNAGGTLYLYNHQEELISEISYPRLQNGQSYASLPAQNPTWQITTLITPGEANQSSFCPEIKPEPNKTASETAQLIIEEQREMTASAQLLASDSASINLANKQQDCQSYLANQQINQVSINQQQSNLPNNHSSGTNKTTTSKTTSSTSKNTATAKPTAQIDTGDKLALSAIDEHDIKPSVVNKTADNLSERKNLPTADEKKLLLPVLRITTEQTSPPTKISSASATNVVTQKEASIVKSTNKAPAPIFGVIGLTAIISGIIIYRLKQQINNLPEYEQNLFSAEKI